MAPSGAYINGIVPHLAHPRTHKVGGLEKICGVGLIYERESNEVNKGDYDGIMFDALTIALCPKLCRHNASQEIFVFLFVFGYGNVTKDK